MVDEKHENAIAMAIFNRVKENKEVCKLFDIFTSGLRRRVLTIVFEHTTDAFYSSYSRNDVLTMEFYVLFNCINCIMIGERYEVCQLSDPNFIDNIIQFALNRHHERQVCQTPSS